MLFYSGKERKRPYDPLDYECIDKVDFWIIEEEPSGELDCDELDEILEDELSNENLHLSRGCIVLHYCLFIH